MDRKILELAAELARRGEPYVLATVVRREAPSSAHTGDMAIVTADGGYHGWLGGSCTQPTVKREAKAALADGKSRLIALSTEPAKDQRAGVKSLAMTCSSGGSVDIFLEPVLPAPRLVVFGVSPLARALARLGKAMGYAVDVADPAADGFATEVDRTFQDVNAAALRPASPAAASGLFAVVATMGESDEDAVAAAAALGPSYLGVVASRKRFGLMRDLLLERGVTAATLERIKNPAGLDLGAKTPEEQALSVLAEIVQLRRAQAASPQPSASKAGSAAAAPADEAEAIDPICGMSVAIAGARHQATHLERAFYFCNARCKVKFLADPERYLHPAPLTSAESAR